MDATLERINLLAAGVTPQRKKERGEKQEIFWGVRGMKEGLVFDGSWRVEGTRLRGEGLSPALSMGKREAQVHIGL